MHVDYENIMRFKSPLKPKIAKNVDYVRLGSFNDGGYIMAGDLTNNDFGVSFGLEQNCDWERDFLKHSAGLHVYDYSINLLPEFLINTRFFKEKIGSEQDLDTSLEMCASRCSPNLDLILKMDIEGSEYHSIECTKSQVFSRFRQICIEFHSLSLVYDDIFRQKAQNCFEKLLLTHTPVYVHANNIGQYQIISNIPIPDTIEMLYLRNTDYEFEEITDPFKYIKKPCSIYKPEVELSFP